MCGVWCVKWGDVGVTEGGNLANQKEELDPPRSFSQISTYEYDTVFVVSGVMYSTSVCVCVCVCA